MTDWGDRLASRGFDADAAGAGGELFASCEAALEAGAGVRAWWVPGRIEVLGKHTDYAGGRSLLCATNVGAAFVARPRDDDRLNIRDVGLDLSADFQVSPDMQPDPGDWKTYPQTVVRRLARNFGPLKGADVAFRSNLPLASGMSSSSALIVAFALVLIELNGLQETEALRSHAKDLESLAGYLGTVENGQTFGSLVGDAGVGTFGGSEDHTAILCCTPGELKQYAFCPVRHEGTVPLPEGWSFVVASSGVVAEKTGAALEKFNRVSRLAAEAVEAVNRGTGRRFARLADVVGDIGAEAAREALMAAGEAGTFTPDELVERFDQFVLESEEVIPAAFGALADGDAGAFGDLVRRSREAGIRHLHNQVEETIWLSEKADALGAAAASPFGAGFGGSVWSLVRTGEAEGFANAWGAAYRETFPSRADASVFIVTRPGPAAFEVAPAQSSGA